jgi:toxin YoeB
MKVIWQPLAKEGLRQIANYIRREFGLKRKKAFMQEVDKTVKLLMRSPNVGQIDPLYANRAFTYRSIIINGLNKLVYRIDNDVIHIVDFWDTRREPKNQASQV